MFAVTLHAAVVGSAGSILVAGGELGATGGDMPILTPSVDCASSSGTTIIDPSLSPMERAVLLCVRRTQLTQCVSGAFQTRWECSVRSLALSGTFFHSILWWTKSVASNLRSISVPTVQRREQQRERGVGWVAIFEVSSGPSQAGSNDLSESHSESRDAATS